MSTSLRGIPSVDRVLRELNDVALPRAVLTDLVRQELDELRKKLVHEQSAPQDGEAIARIRDIARAIERARLRPVINATGVIIHTNFGRSPLAESAVQAVIDVVRGYCNLEYDLSAGVRGGRAEYA